MSLTPSETDAAGARRLTVFAEAPSPAMRERAGARREKGQGGAGGAGGATAGVVRGGAAGQAADAHDATI